MPTGKNGASGDRPLPQFIKYRLSEEELAQAMDLKFDESDLFEFMSGCIDEKLKFSASFDGYGGGVQCFLTPGKEDDVNIGYTLSARAPDLLNAIAVLKFKHIDLFKRDWPKEQVVSTGQAWG